MLLVSVIRFYLHFCLVIFSSSYRILYRVNDAQIRDTTSTAPSAVSGGAKGD